MVALPPSVAVDSLDQLFVDAGLPLVGQGKVRHTNRIDACTLAQRTTRRASIFDFVMPFLVEQKAEVLTALSVYWFYDALGDIPNHLLGFGQRVDDYLPQQLRGNADLQRRTLIVTACQPLDVEFVVRGYLTGGWKDYKKHPGLVFGHKVPNDLFDGSKLPSPIFTPTTKAQDGHDESITFEQMVEIIGDRQLAEKLRDRTLTIYERAWKHALTNGLILADTKFEFDVFGRWIDEALTLDSSRWWGLQQWEVASANRQCPPSLDKELLRQWGKTVQTPWGTGLDKLDPKNSQHLAFIQALSPPTEVLEKLTEVYLMTAKRLLGMSLSEYQQTRMNIAV